jgi:2-polyprenyl-6-methoxyphenol hydroxylase-like FAD-dependent oxidoreductase
MMDPSPLQVIVIGGSIAGISTGIALRCVGCEVSIYERSHEVLRGRGGGLVVQHEMLEWMVAHGITTLETLSIPGVERQFLDQSGRVIRKFPDSTPFTSWDAVFHQLRSAFPNEHYHPGKECVAVSDGPSDCVVEFSDGERVRADMIVGADGLGSIVRRHLFPATKPRYAGYVAWRGVFSESLAPAEVIQALAKRFTLYQGADFHLLTYLIPGENGEVEPGHRRFNWVWYWNTDERTELPNLLLDTSGKRHHASVGAGNVQPSHIALLRERAQRMLPSVLAKIVHLTESPFIQVVYDLQSPALYSGRLLLVGDSACIVRPHTASGTSKASGDAVSLAQHLQASDFDFASALPRWQIERMAVAMRLIHHGRNLARQSGLGT